MTKTTISIVDASMEQLHDKASIQTTAVDSEPASLQQRLTVNPTQIPQLQMVKATTQDAIETRCWERAVEIFNSTLTKDDKKRIDTKPGGDHPTSNLEEMLESAEQAKATSDGRRSSFRKNVETLLAIFNQYAACVDVMIQQAPEILAVVWGSIRFLMGVAVREIENSDALGRAMTDLASHIGRWAKYLQLFSTHTRVQDSIAVIYAQVLNYLVRARCHFEKPWLVRCAKAGLTPTKSKFESILGSIHSASEVLEREIFIAAEANHALHRKEQRAHALRESEEITRQESFRSEFRIVRNRLEDAISTQEIFRSRLEDTFAIQESTSQVLRQNLKDSLSRQDKTYSMAQNISEVIQNTSYAYRQHRDAKDLEKLMNKVSAWLQTGSGTSSSAPLWEEGTCEWIFEHPAYLAWSADGYTKPLWIHGIPGCGKSVMARFLAASAKTHVTVTHFFQDSVDRASCRATPLAVSILSQILKHTAAREVQDLQPVLSGIIPMFDHFSCGQECPFLRIWPVLEAVLSNMPEYTLIIDALDECNDPINNEHLLDRLSNLGSMPNSRVIFLSRLHGKFEDRLRNTVNLAMDSSTIVGDIMHFVRQRIYRETRLQELETAILAKVEQFSQGMFLWAKLMLDDLSQARSSNDQERRLAGFPRGLDSVYTEYLRQGMETMTREERELRREIFTVLVGAVRPLTVHELSYAIALKVFRQLDKRDLLFDPKHQVLRLCWPLAMVVGDYVQLAHMSVKDFLLRPSDGTRETYGRLGLTIQGSNAYLARKCLSELGQEEYKSLDRISALIQGNHDSQTSLEIGKSESYRDTAFYEYACLFWYLHLTAVSEPTNIDMQQTNVFLQSNQFVYWSEKLYGLKSQIDMGPAMEVKAALLSWHALLPPRLRELAPMSSYFSAPFESLRQQYGSDSQHNTALPYLCLFRLGEFANLGESPDKSFNYYLTLAEELRANFDSENLMLMKANHFLAKELISQGQILEGEHLLVTNMDIQYRSLGPEHPDYIMSLEYISIAQWHLTRFEESARGQAEATAGLQRCFGPLRKEVLKSRLFHAYALEAQRKLDEALNIFEDIWKSWVPIMGPENPLSLMAQCSMGAIYRKLRMYDQAKRHLVQNFAARQRVFSLNFPLTVDSGLQLALMHREVGNIEAAEALLDFVSSPGIVDQWFERVCQVAHLRALLCVDRADHTTARQLLRKVFDSAASRGRGANNRELLWIRLKMADLLRGEGNFEEASSLFASLLRPRDEENPVDYQPLSPRILHIAEKGLRLVRDAEFKAAEHLLEQNRLEWVRPKDFWIIFGGEITDTAWINEPQA